MHYTVLKQRCLDMIEPLVLLNYLVSVLSSHFCAHFSVQVFSNFIIITCQLSLHLCLPTNFFNPTTLQNSHLLELLLKSHQSPDLETSSCRPLKKKKRWSKKLKTKFYLREISIHIILIPGQLHVQININFSSTNCDFLACENWNFYFIVIIFLLIFSK